MLRHATIPGSRAWYTWSSRPAEMVFLPLGVRLTPLAYAASTGRATLFPPGEGVRFGRHALDGSAIALDLSHAGTHLTWDYAKPDPFAVAGRWRAEALGEWGLRFWINLCLSAEDGSPVRYDAARSAAVVKIGSRFVALVTAEPAVQITGHASLEAVATDYEAHGYFHLASRALEAPVLVLRFNLEMTRNGRFAVAVADRADLAIERARELAADAAHWPDSGPQAQTGRHAGALDAVRDVVAWNTVFDAINARPYTAISRNWDLKKFGGFGVWLNDQLYAALLGGLFDPEVARENLAVALASATPQGNLACLVTAGDAWVDRTQLPIGAFVVWLMYLRSRSLPLLRLAYDALARNHAWWWRCRDPHGSGLCSYGTSDVGEGLYKGTSFGARNESSMDNAPIHDEAAYDPATRTLASHDVGLNSLLALDAEMLSLIAAALGDRDAAGAHAARAEAVRGKIRSELWDPSRRIFANRLWSGAFVRSLGPTSFYPLLCGAATAGQAEDLVAHLADPKTFGGRFVIPGTARDDPAARDNTYWRGRIWPPLNYLVWQGLRRYGREAAAAALADASFALFRAAWESRRLCPENYNAETGEPLDQPDTEGFYTWGALMPAMAVGEVTDVTPWQGWAIANAGEPLRLGPLETPVGTATITIADGDLTLAKGTTPLLVTDIRGRFSHLRVGDGDLGLTLPGTIEREGRVRLPGVAAASLVQARIGDAEAGLEDAAEGVAIRVGPGDAGRRLRVIFTPSAG